MGGNGGWVMGKTVLVVDDSASVRAMVALTLRQEGFLVAEAGDGVKALSRLGEGGIDLVLADINMPNMDGFALLAAIRASPSLRGIPVVILTTDTEEEKKEKGRRAGATAWIEKPFKPEHLVGVLTRVMG